MVHQFKPKKSHFCIVNEHFSNQLLANSKTSKMITSTKTRKNGGLSQSKAQVQPSDCFQVGDVVGSRGSQGYRRHGARRGGGRGVSRLCAAITKLALENLNCVTLWSLGMQLCYCLLGSVMAVIEDGDFYSFNA